MSDITHEHLANALSALGHEIRLSAFLYISDKQPASVSAGELCDHLKIPHNKLHFHMEKLKQAGLVLYRQQGREVLFNVNLTELESVLKQLMQDGLQVSEVKYRLRRPAGHHTE